MMEIDIQSPRRFIMRSISNKRARSPDSPRSSERASKRTFLVSPHDRSISLQNAPQLPQIVCHSSGYNSPVVREDEWLDQTRGLSIHSPAVECITSEAVASSSSACLVEFPVVQEGFSMRPERHGSMPIDTSDPQTTHLLHRTDFDMEMNGLQPPDSLGASPHSPLSSISDAEDAPERMRIEATPTFHNVDAEQTANASNHSLNHSHCHPEGGVKRKPVLTMGPRADCEKCRARVPGHWMHFD